LAEHYVARGFQVIGCSREPSDFIATGYRHFCLDVADEQKVMELFAEVKRSYGRLDVLVNNAGIASMNHVVLTPVQTVKRIFDTNVTGTFLFCREAAKLMVRTHAGRIINFSTVATPLQLEGEAIYAASKAAVNSLTQILARELAPWNITVNAVGPTPVQTDLIGAVPAEKIDALLKRQAIPRFGEFRDIVNVVDFFVRAESEFVTGQVLYLGGVS
jgi:3-oxoacyl-[acyl-carrier protein] reductase